MSLYIFKATSLPTYSTQYSKDNQTILLLLKPNFKTSRYFILTLLGPYVACYFQKMLGFFVHV
jgi:hypothetical protein